MSGKLTKMAFEKTYSDSSGIKKAIFYDALEGQEDGLSGGVIFQDGEDRAAFSIGEIDWLISCLNRIKEESE